MVELLTKWREEVETSLSTAPEPVGFRLIKSQSVPLTMDLAQKFRDMEASPTERELSQSRLRHLRKKLEQGRFVTCHWATAKLGTKTLRMNGRHSSTIICEANGNFPKGLFAHVDDYEVENENGLADLFRQFDDRKSGRSASDVSGAYQGLHEDLRDIPRDIAKLGIEGITWYEKYFQGAPYKSGDDQYSLFGLVDTHAFLRWLGEVFSIKTLEMKRVTVVSAMYGTFSVNANEARLFWRQVARGGVDYEDNAPSTVLDAWLKSAKEGSKRDLTLKPAHYFQGCVYAWNAYREEKSIKDIKSDTRKGFYKIVE